MAKPTVVGLLVTSLVSSLILATGCADRSIPPLGEDAAVGADSTGADLAGADMDGSDESDGQSTGAGESDSADPDSVPTADSGADAGTGPYGVWLDPDEASVEVDDTATLVVGAWVNLAGTVAARVVVQAAGVVRLQAVAPARGFGPVQPTDVAATLTMGLHDGTLNLAELEVQCAGRGSGQLTARFAVAGAAGLYKELAVAQAPIVCTGAGGKRIPAPGPSATGRP